MDKEQAEMLLAVFIASGYLLLQQPIEEEEEDSCQLNRT
jgi:hypothetical protein